MIKDVIDPFTVHSEFAIEPYMTCLFDVSGGMPKSIALRVHHLDEGHNFQISELNFYYEVLQAERHAIKNLLTLVDQFSMDKNASKTYLWLLDSIYKDQANVSEKIKKLVQDGVNKSRNENAVNFVKSLDVDHAKLDNNTFYERFSTH